MPERRRRGRKRRIRDPFGRTLEGPPEGVMCSPACKYFICTKKALRYDRRTGRFMCSDVDDECIGGQCTYAKCAIGALLSDGRCRLVLSKKAEEPEDIEDKIFEKFEKEFAEEDFERSFLRKRKRCVANESKWTATDSSFSQ